MFTFICMLHIFTPFNNGQMDTFFELPYLYMFFLLHAVSSLSCVLVFLSSLFACIAILGVVKHPMRSHKTCTKIFLVPVAGKFPHRIRSHLSIVCLSVRLLEKPLCKRYICHKTVILHIWKRLNNDLQTLYTSPDRKTFDAPENNVSRCYFSRNSI